MEKWKAEERFPLSHNPGCCYPNQFAGVAVGRSLKVQIILKNNVQYD